MPAKVERLEYDPNRSANIALLIYADGERRYMIAPKGLTVGQKIESGSEAPIKSGNALPLRNIPVGTTVHCVEMLPGKGAQIARAAGAGVQLLAREGEYAQIRMRSGEIRARARELQEPPSAKSATRSTTCARSARRAPIAGAASARRCAAGTMNPVDHPLGGRDARQPPPGVAVGTAGQGQEDTQQQAHADHDRAQPPQEGLRGKRWHVQSRKARSSMGT